ncbi:astacin-like metalloendopeptidase [Paramacrobiotus metropolitanus]|uniref:astacin-like metalloendopeptidase n=1 Tax=Paramacrobiotus metropolitanus TaxID=2943436 RepID=UPI002445CD01|nr:astacin-like metalloendopeptidase [Paramacrobiotus metropolitanus]
MRDTARYVLIRYNSHTVYAQLIADAALLRPSRIFSQACRADTLPNEMHVPALKMLDRTRLTLVLVVGICGCNGNSNPTQRHRLINELAAGDTSEKNDTEQPTAAPSGQNGSSSDDQREEDLIRFEGDILGIDPDALTDQDLKQQANFVTDESKKWPDGVVVYRISTQFGATEKRAIRAAMRDFSARTGIRFVRYARKQTADEETDRMSIVPSLVGCSSHVGRQGGDQKVYLKVPGCVIKSGTIQHEIMHTIGFFHEQARIDRDEYVDINWKNIAKLNRGNFRSYTSNALGQPYDFGSVMHYGEHDFAIDSAQYTIRIKPENPAADDDNMELGQRDGLSPIDVAKIRLAYGSGKGACPNKNGWMYEGKSGREECYFFSFLSSDAGPKSFDAAKQHCATHGSVLAPKSRRATIRRVIKANQDKINMDDEIWLDDCLTFRAEDRRPARRSCSGPALDFVCITQVSMRELARRNDSR